MELILFSYQKEYYNIFINKICTEYLKEKKLEEISQESFLENIKYAIRNVDYRKLKNNFQEVFGFEYDEYFRSTKSLVILFLNMLENL